VEVFGMAVGMQLPRRRSHGAALRRDHEIVGVRVQRLGDEVFTHVRTVRVGCVDQLHPEVDRLPQQPACGRRIGRLTPTAEAGERHRPVAETAHTQVAPDRERRQRQGLQA
jgi:hypothetical protein